MAKSNNINIFDKKYAYIQLLNGENLIAQISKPKEVEEKDENGELLGISVLYKIKSPYRVIEIFDGKSVKSTMISWNPYIESNGEFVINDDTVLLMDKHLKPDMILRYWQAIFLTQDENEDVDIEQVEKDYIDFLYRNPEKNKNLIDDYKKMKDFSETMMKSFEQALEENRKNNKKNQSQSYTSGGRRKSKRRNDSFASIDKQEQAFNDFLRRKIDSFFGPREWIYKDIDLF